MIYISPLGVVLPDCQRRFYRSAVSGGLRLRIVGFHFDIQSVFPCLQSPAQRHFLNRLSRLNVIRGIQRFRLLIQIQENTK